MMTLLIIIITVYVTHKFTKLTYSIKLKNDVKFIQKIIDNTDISYNLKGGFDYDRSNSRATRSGQNINDGQTNDKGEEKARF